MNGIILLEKAADAEKQSGKMKSLPSFKLSGNTQKCRCSFFYSLGAICLLVTFLGAECCWFTEITTQNFTPLFSAIRFSEHSMTAAKSLGRISYQSSIL